MRGLRAGVVALLAGVALAYGFCPQPDLYEEIAWSRAYYDRDGDLLRLTLASDERYRLFTPLAEIAPAMVEATLLYEDRHFHAHPGVNPLALARAFVSTYLTGGRRLGGSTISMQLARIRFGINSRTLPGKLEQILRALQLERHYSKERILEAYLNRVAYGRNIEGVGAASRVYFDKPAAALTLPEALSLAVIPQSPSRRNPTREAGLARLFAARAGLFERWLELHPGDRARQSQMDLGLNFRTPEALPFAAPHLVTRIDKTLAHTRQGEIETTIRRSVQRLIEGHIARYLRRRRPSGIDNAVALLVNHRSMEVEAYVGSADFLDPLIQGQVDGVGARRSPGSVLKPFIYALALDQGLIHPMTLLKDAPRRFGAYTPENYDRGFLGPVFARDALALSRNVPAVHLMSRLERPSFHGFLQAAGILGLRPEDYYGLALALGGLEVSMEEVVRLYAMLANGGEHRPLRLLHDSASNRKGGRLLSPEASFLTLDMLRSLPSPDEPSLPGQLGRGVATAWKTGTSYGFRDAWTAGVFGPYVLAVWVGRFDGEGNPAFVGRRAAAPLFFEIARSVEQRAGGFHEQGEPAGLNIARVEVCAATGDLPDEHCPRTTRSYFIPGKSPLHVTSVYREVPIDVKTGKRACYEDPPRTRLEVFEFWPSDLLALFRTAGIARRLPPPFETDCPLGVVSATGAAPQITAPDSRIIYSLRSERREAERLPFTAVTEADAATLYWFVDDRFVGSVPRGEVFFWQPAVGEFAVRAVDDHGRAAATQLRVQLLH